MNNITAIRNLPENLHLVTNSQDVQAVKDHIGPCDIAFDACFVGEQDGEYTEVWGFVGDVPYLSKLVYKVYPR